MKAVELTQSQIKALEGGASMLILPIVGISIKNYKVLDVKSFIYDWCLLQKGDKFFIQEEFMLYGNQIVSKEIYHTCGLETSSCVGNVYLWEPASQMTYEQSRFKDLECVDVRVVKVQNIEYKTSFKIRGIKKSTFWSDCENEIGMLEDFYNRQMQEQNINRTYEDNDYVFLVEFKR